MRLARIVAFFAVTSQARLMRACPAHHALPCPAGQPVEGAFSRKRSFRKKFRK